MTSDSRTCGYCGKEFMAERFRINAGYAKFCSGDCYHKSTRRRVARKCRQCGVEFTVAPSEMKRGGGQFCSTDCYLASLAECRVEHTCEHCGQSFTLTRADARKTPGTYCSRFCKNEAQRKPRIVRTCEQCGVTFEAYPYVGKSSSRGRFCSVKCLYAWMSLAYRGENSPTWRGGTSFEPYGREWTKYLRASVRERDADCCAVCRLPGKFVHHVDYCKTNNAPENLISLCNSCHSVTNFNRAYWQVTLTGLLERRLGGV